jgi:hypothetical protein
MCRASMPHANHEPQDAITHNVLRGPAERWSGVQGPDRPLVGRWGKAPTQSDAQGTVGRCSWGG